MTSRSELLARIDTTLPDNDNGEITPAALRGRLQDLTRAVALGSDLSAAVDSLLGQLDGTVAAFERRADLDQAKTLATLRGNAPQGQDTLGALAALLGALQAATASRFALLGLADVGGLQAALASRITQADLSAAIAALVGAAPSTLDTIAEIDAAIGNDPNFATTMATALAGKAALVHAHAAADISDSTAQGRAILTAASYAAIKTLLALTAADISGLAAVAKSGSAADLTGTLPAGRLPALTGDVTADAGTGALTIAARVVTFAKLQTVATATFLGRATTGTGSVETLAPTDVVGLLPDFGASGAGRARGLVPLPPSTAGTGKFLREDGTWSAPAAAGGGLAGNVKKGLATANFQTSNRSGVATGLTVTITPSATTSRILITLAPSLYSDSDTAVDVFIKRNGGNASSGTGAGFQMKAGLRQTINLSTLIDSPATTAACTYELWIATSAGTITVDGPGQSALLVQEIGL